MLHRRPRRMAGDGGGVTLFLYSFSYGGITSFVAVYAEQVGVTPRAMYFTVLSIAILSTRPFIGRYADRVGHTPHHRAVPGAGRAWRGDADHRRQPGDVRGLGAAVWRWLRLRLSAVCRALDAQHARTSPRRHLWRDDRRLRYRHRHRVDRHRLDERALRLQPGVCGGDRLAALSIPYYLFMEKRKWITSASAQRA